MEPVLLLESSHSRHTRQSASHVAFTLFHFEVCSWIQSESWETRTKFWSRNLQGRTTWKT